MACCKPPDAHSWSARQLYRQCWDSGARQRALRGGDGHFRDKQAWSVDSVAKLEVATWLQRREHVDQIGSNGDFGDGLRDLARANHEADGAATIISGHKIDPLSDQFDD